MSCIVGSVLYQERKKYFTTDEIQTIYQCIRNYVEFYKTNQNPETFTTILSELIHNAVKANCKKELLESKDTNFQSKFLSTEKVNNEIVYRFRDGIPMEKILENSNHWVHVIIIGDQNKLYGSVINSSPLNFAELKRIRRIFHLSRKRNNFLDIYKLIQPYAELGGMGLAMALQLLKAEGIELDSIQIKKSGDITYSSIFYPPPCS